jgi:hypothetical protein
MSGYKDLCIFLHQSGYRYPDFVPILEDDMTVDINKYKDAKFPFNPRWIYTLQKEYKASLRIPEIKRYQNGHKVWNKVSAFDLIVKYQMQGILHLITQSDYDEYSLMMAWLKHDKINLMQNIIDQYDLKLTKPYSQLPSSDVFILLLHTLYSLTPDGSPTPLYYAFQNKNDFLVSQITLIYELPKKYHSTSLVEMMNKPFKDSSTISVLLYRLIDNNDVSYQWDRRIEGVLKEVDWFVSVQKEVADKVGRWIEGDKVHAVIVGWIKNRNLEVFIKLSWIFMILLFIWFLNNLGEKVNRFYNL